MPLFIKSKILFIHIPKCGGTSIESLMADLGDPPALFDHSGQVMINGHSPQHLTYGEMDQLGLCSPELQMFAVIRDPLERVISEYAYLENYRKDISRHYRSFDGFLKLFLRRDKKSRQLFDNHNVSATDFLVAQNGSIPGNIQLLRYFDKPKIAEILGLTTWPEGYHHLKTGSFERYGNLITPKQESAIRQFFADDFANFKYYFNDIL